MAKQTFPFRFYGLAPRDWFEGANRGHAYELQFATAPSAALRRRIADAVEAAAYPSPVDVDAASWQWAGPWAALLVGERVPGDARSVFAAMGDIARAIHAVAPLEQVVFLGARERGTTGWDAWSAAQQEPTPGPAWPKLDGSMGAYGTPRREGAKVIVDEAFETARLRARDQQRLAHRPTSGLVAVSDAPQPPAPPAADARLFSRDAELFVVGGRTFGVDGDRVNKRVAWVDGKRLRKVALPWFEGLGIDHDGSRLLYASNRLVYEVVLPSTKPTLVLDCGQPLAGVGYGPGNTMLAMTAGYLGLFSRVDDSLENLVTLEVNGSGLHVFGGGSVVVVRGWDERVVVFDCTPTSLVERASYRNDAFTAWEAEGRIFLEDSAGVCELTPPAKAARARAASAKRR